ncbi:MAG: S8 family serine peptidase, partial [Actinomycetota bacterium]
MTTDLGVAGDGIRIAIVDTTVDFGHPNLVGRWAVNADTGSPYFGWPILLDTGTALDNLALFTASSDFDRFPYPFFSSLGTFNQNAFADMHYEIADSDADGFITYQHGLGGYAARADPTGVSGVVNNTRILRDYYVGTPIDPARITSASGTFRLGILKDDFLTAFYGERIGILLVDSTTAGIYDTAYADLDFDFNFTNENAANKASPLLWKDLNADGIPDISGGIVYFISNAATAAVVGEVVTPFWHAQSQTTRAQLANENLSADILPFGLFGAGGMELPTLYLDGGYWPGAGEDIWEELIPAAVGNEKGTTATLTMGENIMSGAVVDTAALLADYNLSNVYAVSSLDDGVLSEGVDYEIDMDTGEITWLRNFGVNDYLDIIYEFDTWRVDFGSGRITFSANATAGSVITANYGTGYPVPYADTLASRHGYDRFVPAAGDLLGVYGAYNGESHGTGTSSTAAGNPVGVYTGDLDIYGQAPSATVISVEMFKPGATIDDAWYFVVEGPDGVPGTGDEAHISSNSWGWIDLPESGWEYYSRLKYWLNTDYAPDTIFVQSTGNEGQGYATESSPTAPTSVQVGAGVSADIYWLFQLIGALPGGGGGAQHTWPFDTGTLGPGPYGDIAPFSSRGPNSLGQPGPDVLAIGHGGLAGIPTNSVSDFLGTFDGEEAWDLFGGTSMAAPIVAGILALMLDGYAQTHAGAMPPADLVISVLKTTADDVKQETISQGAGWANAFRAVKAMMEMEGVVADVHEWVAGDYGGVHRDMFVNLLRAGDSDAIDITLTNMGTSTAAVSLSDGVYRRSGTFSFEWVYNNTGAGSLRTTRPDFWILNETGVYRTNDRDFPGNRLEQAASLATLWNSAAFMKVYTYSDPTVGAQVPVLAVYDWYDVNGNNVWERFTEESYIGPIVFGGDFSETRVNVRTVYDPANRIHTGLGISHSALFGTSDGTPVPTTLYVEFYERVDWSMLSLSDTTLSLTPGASDTVTATLTVPSGTPAGSYAGAIYYSDGTNTSTIQVLVNVPVTSFPASLGGGAAASTLYENNVFSPGTGEPTMGDGRWYWFDTTAFAASNRKMLYNLGWKGGSTSDAEIVVIAPAAESEPDFADDAIFGPSTFELVASTKRNAFVTDTVEAGWEFLGTDVMPGLFLVKLQALRTSSPEELFEANVGTMTVSPDEVRISSNDLEGSAPVTISANVPLRVGTAVDASGAVIYEDLTDVMEDRPVASYPYTSGTYITYLYNAPSRTRTTVIEETRAVSWSLTSHSGAVDVDMGIFYDANCDGTYTVADDVIGHIIGSTYNNPETATLDPPGEAFVPAGCYWVHAAGRDVSAGSLYDLSFETNVPKLQGLGIAVTQAESTTTADLAVDAYGYPGGDFLT